MNEINIINYFLPCSVLTCKSTCEENVYLLKQHIAKKVFPKCSSIKVILIHLQKHKYVLKKYFYVIYP